MIYLLNILMPILRRQLKVEDKTRPRKEVTIIMANDLDTSSKSELKKLTIVTKREYCYGKSFEGW